MKKEMSNLRQLANRNKADEIWLEMRNEMLLFLEEKRRNEVTALEASKLVPDRHYHKGKIHLIDDIIQEITR